MIIPPLHIDTTLPPNVDQVLFPSSSPMNRIYKHTEQKKQKLYGLIKNLAGRYAFDHLTVINDKRTLQGIGSTAICSRIDLLKYDGIVRGSYYFRYSFINFKCLINGNPGSIFILDNGKRGETLWAILSDSNRSINIMDKAEIRALVTNLFENYEAKITIGLEEFTVKYKPCEKL